MKKVVTIWKKEALGYATSLRAYVMVAMMTFFSAVWFSLTLALSRESSMRGVVSLNLFVLLAITPILTMRSIAEENSRGTLELLLTSPVSEWDVVLGKFLGTLTLFIALFAVSLVFPAVLFKVGEPEWGPLLTQYLVMIGAAAAFTSVGLFASSITESQVIAAIVSYIVLLLFWVSGFFGQALPDTWANIFKQLSISSHIDNFAKGVLDATDVYYFVAVTAAFLFLTYRAVEARRWAA